MDSTEQKKSILRRAKERGLTLIEAAMVLAIATLVVAGIMLFFQTASSSNKGNSVLSQLAAIQSAVQSLYSGQPTYSGLDTDVVGASGILPEKMTVLNGGNQEIKHAFNDDFIIAGATNSYTVDAAGIPKDACLVMVTKDLGRGMISLQVGTGTAVNNRAMTPAEATTACASESNLIQWEFY